jgi:hypothetical protein
VTEEPRLRWRYWQPDRGLLRWAVSSYGTYHASRDNGLPGSMLVCRGRVRRRRGDRDSNHERLESPEGLDSQDSLRSSSLTPFAPAVLTSSGFVQTLAPFSPPGVVSSVSGVYPNTILTECRSRFGLVQPDDPRDGSANWAHDVTPTLTGENASRERHPWLIPPARSYPFVPHTHS